MKQIDVFMKHPREAKSLWITTSNSYIGALEALTGYLENPKCPDLCMFWFRIVDIEGRTTDIPFAHYLCGEYISPETYREMSQFA